MFVKITGHEEYLINNEGQVYSTKRGGRLLKPRIGNHGYYFLTLKKNSKSYGYLIHRLVARAFLGECPDGMEVRHLDGNKYNNRLNNLAYGSSRDNKLDTVAHGNHHNANKTHCIRGHKFTKKNMYVYGNKRQCKRCKEE